MMSTGTPTAGDLAARPMLKRSDSFEMHAGLVRLGIDDLPAADPIGIDDPQAAEQIFFGRTRSASVREKHSEPEAGVAGSHVTSSEPERPMRSSAKRGGPRHEAESKEALVARRGQARLIATHPLGKRVPKQAKLSSPMPHRGFFSNISSADDVVKTSLTRRPSSSRYEPYATSGRSAYAEDAAAGSPGKSQAPHPPKKPPCRGPLRGP